MDRYEDYLAIAKEKFDAELIEKDREIAEAKETYLGLKKEFEDAYAEFKKLGYAKNDFMRKSDQLAMSMFMDDMKDEYMEHDSQEVFEKFFEMARQKADSYNDIESELEELLNFYNSVEKAKKG